MVVLIVSICYGDQTPSWFPSSPNGEIVGNMMQSVVLDGNPVDEDDGNLLDKFVLYLMNLLNDVNLMMEGMSVCAKK